MELSTCFPLPFLHSPVYCPVVLGILALAVSYLVVKFGNGLSLILPFSHVTFRSGSCQRPLVKGCVPALALAELRPGRFDLDDSIQQELVQHPPCLHAVTNAAPICKLRLA